MRESKVNRGILSYFSAIKMAARVVENFNTLFMLSNFLCIILHQQTSMSVR